MKNLKQLAAQFGYYQAEEIPEKYKTYSVDWINSEKNDIPEALKKMPSIEIGVFYECKVQDEGTAKELFYVERMCTTILIKSKETHLLMSLRGNDYSSKGKYYLSPDFKVIKKYYDISHYKKEQSLKGLKEPNQIGVFTEKKVSEWIAYCTEYINRMEILFIEVNEKNLEQENQIQDFIKSIPGCSVNAHGNKTWVTTPLFEINFEHFKDQNFLSTKITYRGTLRDVIKIETK